MFAEDADNSLKILLKENKNTCFFETSQITFVARIYINIYSCFFPRNLANIIIDCISSGKNSAYVGLSINNEGKVGHANALIFNYINNVIEIERYEPHGANGSYTSFIDQYLIKLFTQDFSKLNYKIKYFTPLEYCPYFGAQAHAKDTVGYCVIFSAMYIFDRLSHPEMTRNQIADMYTKKASSLVLKETEDFLVLLDSFPKIDRTKSGNYIDNPKKYEFRGFFPTEKFLDSKSNKFIRDPNANQNFIEYFENIPQEYISDLDNTNNLQSEIQEKITSYSRFLNGSNDDFWNTEINSLKIQLEKFKSRLIKTVSTEETSKLFNQEYEKLKNEQSRIISEKQKLSKGKVLNQNTVTQGNSEKERNAYLTLQNNIRLEKLGVKVKTKKKTTRKVKK